MGDITFGKGAKGEWAKSRMLQVQYHDIKQGAGLDVWKGMSYQTVLTPADLKTGNVIYPYEKALQVMLVRSERNDGAGANPAPFSFVARRMRLTCPDKACGPGRCC